MGCDSKNCGGCTKCGGCSGCGAGELLITPQELQILEQLGVYAFLPVARRADTMQAHCLEEGMPEDSTLAIALLERKNLVRLDYDKPLSNFAYEAYGLYPVHGCMSLTRRGQRVLELLDIQGCD